MDREGFPRACGDKPMEWLIADGVANRYSNHLVFPVHAGMSLPELINEIQATCFPRMRG